MKKSKKKLTEKNEKNENGNIIFKIYETEQNFIRRPTQQIINKMKGQYIEWEKVFVNDATDRGLV